ncbi:MAG: hypothetical protein D6706_02425 [Chloroflexi bacterium]|nr:MAG: hypothetical protein D6706_02425 [Chloroflexota bacterium]
MQENIPVTATNMTNHSATTRPVRKRKHIIMPAEHGSWSWFLVPFLTGVLVAGQFNLAVLLTLVGGLAAFLMRQPATVWLRASRGKGRRSDAALAAKWTLGLGGTAVLSLAGLLWLGHTELLWLALPIMPLLAIYLFVAYRKRANTRSLGMEMAGAIALAIMAPAALAAATGSLSSTSWVLWGVLAAKNVLGGLYARTRIFDTHNRPVSRSSLFWWHLGVALLAGWLVFQQWLPWLALIPFLFLLVRATWTAVSPRPIANIRRFGFGEMGLSFLIGLIIAAGYWLG